MDVHPMYSLHHGVNTSVCANPDAVMRQDATTLT